jgi:hypothetical protein
MLPARNTGTEFPEVTAMREDQSVFEMLIIKLVVTTDCMDNR